MELSGLVDWRCRPRPDSCGAGLVCSRKDAVDLRGLPAGPCLSRASTLRPSASSTWRPYCVLSLWSTQVAPKGLGIVSRAPCGLDH